jgi:hypothetical protein
MKVRVGNVVFEDFNANELDVVIEKLRKVGLLGSGSSGEIQAPRPVPRPVPAPKPVLRTEPKPKPTLPRAPTPPAPKSKPEEESSSSGWL